MDKIGDVVKQEKKSEIMGKENLDENVDDPPPAVPSKPAKAAKKLPKSRYWIGSDSKDKSHLWFRLNPE